MKKELFPLCDDDGNVIGTIERKQAHSTGAWHKSVHVYIVNNKNEILMQLRSSNKDIAPNVWDISVGGHVDAGEESIVTAQRETEEELGIKADQSEFQFIFTTKETLISGNFISREFVDAFILQKDISEKDVHLQKSEVSTFKFVGVEEFCKQVKARHKDFVFHLEEFDKIIPVLKQLKNENK